MSNYGLTKEELDEFIPLIIAGDQEKFQLFYEAYNRCVKDVAQKWQFRINKASNGMHDFEDVENELWIRVLQVMPRYNSNVAKMTTYIYLVCRQHADRIWRFYASKLRSPGDRFETWYLDAEINDDQMLSLHAIIENPSNAIRDFESESELFYQIYILKLFISKLTQKQKVVYLHQVKELTLQASGDILSLSRERVRQIRVDIRTKLEILLEKEEVVTPKESADFSLLLLSSLEDEEISDQFGHDLATIKICRELLSVTDLYIKAEEGNLLHDQSRTA